uniref:Reverse transcriptase domain-containing protein n=1 Tax=Tanacetum cinerariifolium TaxID=118510 RepID=A0A6L2K5A6_TANCI|nr:reverse transcriptase domain-containing protein [Tanacetum cinerariifolium]
MAEGDEDKIAFFAGKRVFYYQKMPFALMNTRATYQRLVDKVFHNEIGSNFEAYVDDMVNKSTSEEDMLVDIKETYERMEIYMQNREHGKIILEAVEHDPLIWPTIEENGVTRTEKYKELSAAEKIQADCDHSATNIILQGLTSDVYSLVNHYRVSKDLWE